MTPIEQPPALSSHPIAGVMRVMAIAPLLDLVGDRYIPRPQVGPID
jgi:hypothetical protein